LIEGLPSPSRASRPLSWHWALSHRLYLSYLHSSVLGSTHRRPFCTAIPLSLLTSSVSLCQELSITRNDESFFSCRRTSLLRGRSISRPRTLDYFCIFFTRWFCLGISFWFLVSKLDLIHCCNQSRSLISSRIVLLLHQLLPKSNKTRPCEFSNFFGGSWSSWTRVKCDSR